MIVTIDGPAGTGKSTLARRLARELGFAFLDTGATFRAATLKAVRLGLDLDDEAAVARMLAATRISALDTGGGLRVTLDGEDVSAEIRTPEVTRRIVHLARAPRVRAALVEVQRAMAAGRDVVAEGRDTGTVVFPWAEVKFYLDARPEERARRRWLELGGERGPQTLAEVLAEMAARDRSDLERATAPLRIPDGATTIDTTALGIEEVLAVLLDAVRKAPGWSAPTGPPPGGPRKAGGT